MDAAPSPSALVDDANAVKSLLEQGRDIRVSFGNVGNKWATLLNLAGGLVEALGKLEELIKDKQDARDIAEVRQYLFSIESNLTELRSRCSKTFKKSKTKKKRANRPAEAFKNADEVVAELEKLMEIVKQCEDCIRSVHDDRNLHVLNADERTRFTLLLQKMHKQVYDAQSDYEKAELLTGVTDMDLPEMEDSRNDATSRLSNIKSDSVEHTYLQLKIATLDMILKDEQRFNGNEIPYSHSRSRLYPKAHTRKPGTDGQDSETDDSFMKATKVLHTLIDADTHLSGFDFICKLWDLFHALATLHLNDEATEIGYRAWSMCIDLARSQPDDFDSSLASSITKFSFFLRTRGRDGKALEVIEEANEIQYRLVRDRPSVFNPTLADSLNYLTILLNDLGRTEEAFRTVQESVRLGRIAASENPGTSTISLARSVNNYANLLVILKRHEEALKATEEAVHLWRTLARDRAEDFSAHLAGSLKDLSHKLRRLGRHDEELTAIREAVQIQREVARARHQLYNVDLANNLNDLSNTLSAMNFHKDALEVTKEAIEMWRKLYRSSPETFSEGLANCLDYLSLRNSAVGNHVDALEAITEAIPLRRGLAHDQPRTFAPLFATSLNNLSNCLYKAGRDEEALEAIRGAVVIMRQLALDDPQMYKPDLALSLVNMSHRLGICGHLDEALEVAKEAHQTWTDLTSTSEHPEVHDESLALSQTNLSNQLNNMGRQREALVATREAVEKWRNLFHIRPQAYSRNLVNSVNDLAARFIKVGRHGEALEVLESMVKLRQGFPEQRALACPSELVVSLVNFSTCLEQLRRRDEPLKPTRKAEQPPGHPETCSSRDDTVPPMVHETSQVLGEHPTSARDDPQAVISQSVPHDEVSDTAQEEDQLVQRQVTSPSLDDKAVPLDEQSVRSEKNLEAARESDWLRYHATSMSLENAVPLAVQLGATSLLAWILYRWIGTSS